MRTAITVQGSDMWVEECCVCGTPFAFSETLHEDRRVHGELLYCPNGHSQSYIKPLRKVLEETRRDRDEALAARDKAEAALRTLKARVQNGTCALCHRHVANVQRHMATKHKQATP